MDFLIRLTSKICDRRDRKRLSIGERDEAAVVLVVIVDGEGEEEEDVELIPVLFLFLFFSLRR